MPKTLDKFQEIKYNNIERYKELMACKNSINSGKLSPLVDFELYHTEVNHFKTEILGLETQTGIQVKSISKHFYERYFGSVEDRRDGVTFDAVRNCIIDGEPQEIKTDKKGRTSQVFSIQNVAQVSINPKSGELIQVNPLSKKK